MAHTIVGSFADQATATKVQQDLISAGFDRDEIHLTGGKPQTTATTGQQVHEPQGFWDSVKDFFGFSEDDEDRTYYQEAYRRGQIFVSVDSDSEEQADRAVGIFQSNGVINLQQQAEKWRAEGWTGGATAATRPATSSTSAATGQNTTAASRPAATVNATGNESLNVVQEELQVGKRQVNRGGVRVYTKVTQKPVQEQINLREEHVDVQRRPVNRPLTDADKAFQERTIEATETAEQAVVSKQARVVEEVVVNKAATQRTETVKDTVRRQDVQVEQIPGREQTTFSAASPSGAAASGEDWYRSDYQSHYGSSGKSYDYYRPAYEYGRTLSGDQTYRGRDWSAIESDARRGFEQKNPGSAWEDFKDTIRRAYERVKSSV